MITIQMTQDSNMKFIDPETKKQQWYSTDMLVGHTMEFKDIKVATNKNVTFVCLDDELALLPLQSFLIKSVSDF